MSNMGYLQITRACNQNCRFCSNPDNDRVIEFETAMGIMARFKENNYAGVILTGGEPTLHPRLADLIRYASQLRIFPRIISNGQLLACKSYLDELVAAGLKHLHLSFHSHKAAIHNALTDNRESWQKLVKALENCDQAGITVNINTVINRYNADHLHETARWLVQRFPSVRHFVWNNLDPFMNRVEQNPDVIPHLQHFEIALCKAAGFLAGQGITFRIERVPLCYMVEFAECSTETRKIVKKETREIHFLDQRGRHQQDNFFYEKPPVCRHCSLDSICAGVYGGDRYFCNEEIYPLFVNTPSIVDRILGNRAANESGRK